METKFTKGEWKHITVATPNGFFSFERVTIENGESICYITTRNSEQAIANAKLIAAAPDMYETLIKVKEWLIDMNLPIIDNIEKAIKKATE